MVHHPTLPLVAFAGTVVWQSTVGISVDGTYQDGVLRLQTSTARPNTSGNSVLEWEAPGLAGYIMIGVTACADLNGRQESAA